MNIIVRVDPAKLYRESFLDPSPYGWIRYTEHESNLKSGIPNFFGRSPFVSARVKPLLTYNISFRGIGLLSVLIQFRLGVQLGPVQHLGENPTSSYPSE